MWVELRPISCDVPLELLAGVGRAPDRLAQRVVALVAYEGSHVNADPRVVRHAQARTILVSIRYEPERVQIAVQDDGVGMARTDLDASADGATHFGLSDMRRRILDVGGTFEIESGDEGGVTIRIDVPVPARKT